MAPSTDPLPRHCELKIAVVVVEIVAIATCACNDRTEPLIAAAVPEEVNNERDKERRRLRIAMQTLVIAYN